MVSAVGFDLTFFNLAPMHGLLQRDTRAPVARLGVPWSLNYR